MGVVRDFYQLHADWMMACEDAEGELEGEGELSPETLAELRELAKGMREGVEQMALWDLQLAAREAGLRAKYKPILDTIKKDIAVVTKLREVAQQCINIAVDDEKKETFNRANEQVYMYYQPSQRVEADAKLLPDEYVERVPKKQDLAVSLKAGKTIPGAKLATNLNLVIKPGGEAAVKANKARLKRRGQG